jgi:hypothetical protein
MDTIPFDKETLGFALYCIDILADRTGKSRACVFKMLAHDSDVLSRVVVGEYSTLHTQGEAYICDELLEEMGAARD